MVVERLAEQLGIKSLSHSRVSEMATHLDAQVAAFREGAQRSPGHHHLAGVRAS
ncbi:hypothetical protein [Pseudonocardia adelaidensis]|uniref:hypothetical protein n=1 Tax=Pseudonocardia adelaidensis TaxID=648754 RepID=UPI0031EDA550